MEDRECRDAFYGISHLANIAQGLSDAEQLGFAREILAWAEQILTPVGPRDTTQVDEIAPDADANALFDLMEREADHEGVYWGGDAFRRQAQTIIKLAEVAEQRLLSSMPETRQVMLHEEHRNKLQEYLSMHRQHIEECCTAYRNGRSVCLRSHELHRREPSTFLLCCLCGGQRPSNFCMSCADCSWDACGQCIDYLRNNVARLEEHARELQQAEGGLAVGLLPCFYPENPLNFASFTAVAAALEPSHQNVAICLESIQVTQILHEMPVPNVRYSRILKEAALEMRNGQNAGMLLKVSNCLAPKQFMPPNRATSPRCRPVSIRWLLPQLCFAAAVLLLANRPTNRPRFHQEAAPTKRMQLYQNKAVVATCCGLAGLGCTLKAVQSQSPSQSPIISDLPPCKGSVWSEWRRYLGQILVTMTLKPVSLLIPAVVSWL